MEHIEWITTQSWVYQIACDERLGTQIYEDMSIIFLVINVGRV
jgi:hypothetical protein